MVRQGSLGWAEEKFICLFRIWKQVSRGTEGGCGGGEAEGSGGDAALGGLTHSCDHTGRVVGGEWEARGRVHGCGGAQHVA